MSKTKTEKALKSLKYRVDRAEDSLEWFREQATVETYEETIKVLEEIKILTEAYEKQIELNKKQNLKIKNQRGMLKALQRKQGDNNGKTNI